MKRFSSALCLNDKVQDQHETIRGQAAAEEADDSKQQQKRQTRRLARQSKQSARKLGEQASAATSNERQAFGSRQKQQGRDSVCSREQRPPRGQDSHLLAPDDPVVALARQRRPSLTNQGSVNVDQQGECATLNEVAASRGSQQCAPLQHSSVATIGRMIESAHSAAS